MLYTDEVLLLSIIMPRSAEASLIEGLREDIRSISIWSHEEPRVHASIRGKKG